MAERETSAAIDATAAQWVARLDAGPVDPADQARLDAWLDGDSRRMGAFARARAILIHAQRTRALGPEFDPDRYAEKHGAMDPPAAPAETVAASRTDDAPPRTTRRRFLIGGGSAIGIGVATAVGFSWQAAAATFTTRRGEIRLIPLDDGSSMTLNTQSTARVRFSRNERHVELVGGEALFDVVPDPDRPFVVEAGNSRVEARATSFTVTRLASRPVEILVRQGRLTVTRADVPAAPVTLVANNRAAVADAGTTIATAPVAPAELGRAIAWQQGMISFEDTPLAQAAAQFARYSDTAIKFDDPAIGRETITGLYGANDPQGFARSAALSLGLRTREEAGAIVIAH